MSAPDRDWDLLLHRYLEGTLGPEEASVLNPRLKEDPAFARRLAEMSIDVVQMRDLGAGEIVEPVQGEAEPRRRRSWPKGSVAAAAAILLAVLVALMARTFQGDGTQTSPQSESALQGTENPAESSWIDEVDGFQGWVHGRIVKIEGRSVHLFVKKMLRANGRARNPQALAGRTVPLKAGAGRSDEDGGRNPVHLAFLRSLGNGDEDVIEIAHEEDGAFRILRLTGVQEDRAKSDPESRRRRVRESRGDGDGEADEERRREGGDRPRRKFEGDPERERGKSPERRIRRDDDREGRSEGGEERRRRREGDERGNEKDRGD